MSVKNRSKAVSPIIGTILLVAVTIILVAVVGTFVFGLGTHVEHPPKVQFELKDSVDRIDDNDARDLIATLTHVKGDTIECSEIQIIVKDKTNGKTWVLEMDGNVYEYDNISQTLYMFYDPNKEDTPIILVFGKNKPENVTEVVFNKTQLGPEYYVRNDGMLMAGDTVVLMEGNVTLRGFVGSYDFTSSDEEYLTRWLANIVKDQLGFTFRDAWNPSNTPAEIEVTIIHIPTRTTIWQGSVTVR
jgi:flagellin-like protein